MVYLLKILSHLLNIFFLFTERFKILKNNLEKINKKVINKDLYKFLFYLFIYFFKVLGLYKSVPCNLSKAFILELEMFYFFQKFFLIIRFFFKKNLTDILFILRDNLSLKNLFLYKNFLLKNTLIKKKLFLTILRKESSLLNYNFFSNITLLYRRFFLIFYINIKNIDKRLFEILKEDIKYDISYLYIKHYYEYIKHFLTESSFGYG